jgi:hypothetical protein
MFGKSKKSRERKQAVPKFTQQEIHRLAVESRIILESMERVKDINVPGFQDVRINLKDFLRRYELVKDAMDK